MRAVSLLLVGLVAGCGGGEPEPSKIPADYDIKSACLEPFGSNNTRWRFVLSEQNPDATEIATRIDVKVSYARPHPIDPTDDGFAVVEKSTSAPSLGAEATIVMGYDWTAGDVDVVVRVGGNGHARRMSRPLPCP